MRCLMSVLVMLSTACERRPRLLEYEPSGNGIREAGIASAPVFLVGQIAGYQEIGSPKPSRFDKRNPMQLCRITLKVENVLRGNIKSATVSIYYLVNVGSNGGPPRLGMIGRSGIWRMGDREIFALRWNSGVLRTLRDTYPEGVEQVLTGAHPDYRPSPGEPVLQTVIDILLSKGRDCTDAQMSDAVRRFRAYHYDLAYSVRKLRNLAAEKSPEIREAALKKLSELAYSWPQISSGWPEAAEAGSYR